MLMDLRRRLLADRHNVGEFRSKSVDGTFKVCFLDLDSRNSTLRGASGESTLSPTRVPCIEC